MTKVSVKSIMIQISKRFTVSISTDQRLSIRDNTGVGCVSRTQDSAMTVI